MYLDSLFGFELREEQKWLRCCGLARHKSACREVLHDVPEPLRRQLEKTGIRYLDLAESFLVVGSSG
jgi:hypothetical protein